MDEPESSSLNSYDKNGVYFSRGTLVICHVSLVGQWVQEAKSKLRDPGLVYSYYGSNRQQNPKLLAKNSIVVTTYREFTFFSFLFLPWGQTA
mmetsp:Transcript_35965/g.83942  ORF Transcript_35965/g.83942 Transcript_35965/m.83942 type:complete len:92 (-) Transcript_35965:2052-2327(-)